SVGSGSGSLTGGMLPSSTAGGSAGDQPPHPLRQDGINVTAAAAAAAAAAASSSPVGRGHEGDVPTISPTPSSTTSSGGHSSRSGVRGSVNLGGRSVSPIGNDRQRQSPLARPQGASSRGGGARAAPRGAQFASAMPHGLTVQELKELTKIRLAREALTAPAQPASSANPRAQQQRNNPGSDGGGDFGRGRAVSPAISGDLGRRRGGHADSRSPVPRSSPSTPGVEDRPHRRTRRGGRRGRNSRSPRPNGQHCSPKLGDEDSHQHRDLRHHLYHDGYSSASPSPRIRRGITDPWAYADDDKHPRSSSQPRAVSRDDNQVTSGEVSGGGSIGPAPAASEGGREGGAPGGGERGSTEAEAAAAAERLSAIGSPDLTLEAKGHPTSGGSGGGAGGGYGSPLGGGSGRGLPNQQQPSTMLPEAASSSSGRRPVSMPLPSGGDSRQSSSLLMMGDELWAQEFRDLRRQDGAAGGGRGSAVDAGITAGDHHDRGGGRDRDPLERAAGGWSGDRPRSLHHFDRGQLAEERRRFAEDQVRERGPGGSTARVHGMIGGERLTSLSGFEESDASASHARRFYQEQQHQRQYHPHAYPRLQRARSDGLVSSSHHAGRGGSAELQERDVYDGVQQHYRHSGYSRGSDGGKPPPPPPSRIGDRYHANHHQQQPNPHWRYSSGDSYRSHSQQQQQHHHQHHQHHQHHHHHHRHPDGADNGTPGVGSRNTGAGSTRHLPAHHQQQQQQPQLVSRRSDGGVVVSSAAYHRDAGRPTIGNGSGGGAGGGFDRREAMFGGDGVGLVRGAGTTGGGRHGSPPSFAEGDISLNASALICLPPVAESVLVTPRTAAGGSWKNTATSTQEIAAGAAEAAVVPPWKGFQAENSQQQRQVRFYPSASPHPFHATGDTRGFEEGGGSDGGSHPRHTPGGARHDYSAAAASRVEKRHEPAAPTFRRKHEGAHPTSTTANRDSSINHQTGGYPGWSSGSDGGGGFVPGGADSVGRASPLIDSPLVTGLSFPLEFAGHGGGGGGGARVFGRTGSEGALSAHGSVPAAAVAAIFSATRSEGKAGSDDGGQGTAAAAAAGFTASAAGEGAGRGFASGLFGLDTVGGGVGIGSSPSSHNSAGPVDAAPAMMPQQLNLGRGFGGGGSAIGSGMDPPLHVDSSSLFSSIGQRGRDGGGGDVMHSGHRQSSSVSSAPVGGERGGAVGGGGPVGAIGSSRNIASNPVAGADADSSASP
ncbi:unnamed protein product, partial [Ectocarpus sp. 12 AP-2014]